MARLPIKSLPLIGIVLLVGAIGFFLINPDSEEPGGAKEERTSDETVPAADINIEKFKVYEPYTDKGITWTLDADEAGYSEKSDETALLKRFRLKYKKRNGFEIELEGENAEYNSTGTEINLFGGIKGKTENGYIFYTEHLIFQQKENCLKTDAPVTFTGPFFKMTGNGMFMDLKSEKLKLLKDINSTIDIESLNI